MPKPKYSEDTMLLCAALNEQGWSNAEMAAELNIEVQTIARWFSGFNKQAEKLYKSKGIDFPIVPQRLNNLYRNTVIGDLVDRDIIKLEDRLLKCTNTKTGEVYITNNIKRFCEEHGLYSSALNVVVNKTLVTRTDKNGNRYQTTCTQHKGWVAEWLDTDDL